MNVAEFHQNIDQIWDSIEEQLEAQDADADCDRQGSVFTITFDDRCSNFGWQAVWADCILPGKITIGSTGRACVFGMP